MPWPAVRLRSEVREMLNRKVEGENIIFTEGASHVLTMTEKETDEGVLITLKGSLRSDVTHDFLDELIAMTTVGADVYLDFKDVTYVAPSVQHSLLIIQQKMDSMGMGTLTLREMPDEIYREFERSGEADLLMIER